MSELQYMPQLNVDYFKSLDKLDSIEIQNAIKISLMMVEGFRDILDDLNFDEEKLRILQFTLDDDYDVVEEIFQNTTNQEIKEILDRLLVQIAKLDMEIGDLILEHTNVS